jgi:hypothetical protein
MVNGTLPNMFSAEIEHETVAAARADTCRRADESSDGDSRPRCVLSAFCRDRIRVRWLLCTAVIL